MMTVRRTLEFSLNRLWFLTAGLLFFACTAAAETPLATYDCRLPDARLGGGMVLKVFADARATLTIKGVVIAGQRDPEVEYSYTEDGTTLKLSPRSNSARQIGVIRYARSSDTLTLVNNNGSLNCEKG